MYAQALVLKNRALIYDDLGEYERALHDFRQAQATFHRLGNVRGEESGCLLGGRGPDPAEASRRGDGVHSTRR